MESPVLAKPVSRDHAGRTSSEGAVLSQLGISFAPSEGVDQSTVPSVHLPSEGADQSFGIYLPNLPSEGSAQSVT